MEAKELQINSYYNSVKWQKPVRLELSDLNELYHRCDGAELDSEIISTMFEPIELTEEWLIKTGYDEEIKEWKGNGQDWQPETSKTKQRRFEIFEDIYLVFTYFSYRANEKDKWITDRSISVEYYGDSIQLTRYYIHTFQNLIFALTGKELTYDLR